MRGMIGISALSLVATPAFAEIVAATPAGFEVRTSVAIDAPPAAVWVTLVAPARWWDGAHTYSGKAANLTLAPHAGGCFCESLPDGGSVEHARVIFAQPRAMLRLDGALGALQAEAVTARLTFALKPEGKGTIVTMTYVVGGNVRGGADRLAAPVDQVMALQVARLKAAAERR